jgi:hypothetical protein
VNLASGLDVLLHGSRNAKGWGEEVQPDPTLYNVRGFDPISRGFLYSVNPRFGRAALGGSSQNPFRFTIDLSLNLGPSIPAQQLAKALSPGRNGRRGPRLTQEQIKARYARNVPDPYQEILAESDSLLLSKGQIDSLLIVDSTYKARIDSVWTSLASYLESLEDSYNTDEAVARANASTDAAWEITRKDVQATLGSILSPIQLRLMPAAGLYTSRGPIRGRTYRY